MSAYLYLAKIRIQSQIAYRFEVFSTIMMQCFVMFAICFFWIAMYGDTQSVMDVTKKDMLTYTMISAVLGCLFKSGVQSRVVASVRNGSVAVDMLKPISLYGMYFAEDFGSSIVSIFKNALPIFLIGGVFFGMPLPSSGINLILFLISFIFSYMINWFFSALFSMWVFSAINIGPLFSLKGYIISLLSGSVIPIWFFPKAWQSVFAYLPFQYIYQLPLGIYIGKYSGQEIMFQMCIQIMWIIIFFGAFCVINRLVSKKIMVQGG